jgi:hypothetical protein
VYQVAELRPYALFPQKEQVRSSIARHLGIDIGALTRADRNIDGVVEMILDATQNYAQHLTKEKLFEWHRLLFPANDGKLGKIRVGDWRDDARSGLNIIATRAESLSRFMQAYARLARLPPPQKEPVDLGELVRRVANLETRIAIRVVPGPDVIIQADAAQLEQLLINILQNAAEASKGMNDVAKNVDAVSGAAKDTTRGAADTNSASKELARLAERAVHARDGGAVAAVQGDRQHDAGRRLPAVARRRHRGEPDDMAGAGIPAVVGRPAEDR